VGLAFHQAGLEAGEEIIKKGKSGNWTQQGLLREPSLDVTTSLK